MTAVCAICGQYVTAAQARLDEEIGWLDRTRKAGGPNALRNARPTGRVAHRVCVDEARVVGQDRLPFSSP